MLHHYINSALTEKPHLVPAWYQMPFSHCHQLDIATPPLITCYSSLYPDDEFQAHKNIYIISVQMHNLPFGDIPFLPSLLQSSGLSPRCSDSFCISGPFSWAITYTSQQYPFTSLLRSQNF